MVGGNNKETVNVVYESSTSDDSGLCLFGDYALIDTENKSFRVGRLPRMQR